MPYIDPARRGQIAPMAPVAETEGELNFQITCLVKQYIDQYGVSYARINEVVGCLESAKLEFYRRIASPYEDAKVAVNGDVY